MEITKIKELQDQIIEFVRDLAEYAGGVELDVVNTDFDGDTLYVSFEPADLLTIGDYGVDDLVADLKKNVTHGKHHILVDLDKDEEYFTVEISNLKN